MSRREKAIARIKALLKRTADNGASKAEVKAAMAMADKMMSEWEVEMSEAMDSAEGVQLPDCKQAQVRRAATISRWEKQLLTVVQIMFNVRTYYSNELERNPKTGRVLYTKKGKPQERTALYVYGLEHEVDAAWMCYQEAYVVIRAMARAHAKTVTNKQEFYYYADGFTEQLIRDAQARKKAAEAARARNCTTLIVHRDKAIDNWLEQSDLSLGPGKSRGGRTKGRDSEAFSAGTRDGANYAPGSDKVANTRKNLR